ncbi:MAG: lysozyme family protein [Bacillota bacterium]|uniref:Lysozyme family protein n=1 Tax=Virgibacillus salarius TaxID=447199 RepID=A0A941E0H8_9BACI|nr:lysozyme family protein [Virgibacillus salarius]MBR7796703.1 lysozyme family protein [Virgibacillus salarius]NAZ09413.1 transglycosylase SLT domain-containing protein [Agaribacter marinus]
MKRNKKIKTAIKRTIFLAFLLFSLFIGISLLAYQEQAENSSPTSSSPIISEEVKAYRPVVEKYAKQYDVSQHIDTLLAMMMQESGGRGDDPMQSSESYCGERGCIQDPELSIKQGVYYFSQTLKEANGDLLVAVQSYNFGKGFINYMKKHSDQFSQEAAITFSQEMYANDPDKEKYRCLRDGAEELGACYGDIYYVKSVMAYKDKLAEE